VSVQPVTFSGHTLEIFEKDHRHSATYSETPQADFLLGTFLPFARASESPIAIACFLLFTVLPLPPLLSVPALRRFMAPFTSSDADLEYRAMVFFPLGSSKTAIPSRKFRKDIH
jgi:hypothetical protein